MQVYDIFCGGGCFSSAVAAKRGGEDGAGAGATAAFGVDHWGVAVATFQRNHARAVVRGVALPATWAALRPPEPALGANASVHTHAHFSPPCCAFSSARHGRETEAEREEGNPTRNRSTTRMRGA